MVWNRVAIAVSVLVALKGRAQSPGGSALVPRGAAITIDGRVDDDEWRHALRVEQPAGTVVRLLRDDASLYVGITSTRPGFASLCALVGDEVRVLHASAALGAVTYRRQGESWRSADTAFSYGMRNTALTDAARAERAAYLASQGWVASTLRMSPDGRAQEMEIDLRKFPLPVSVALARWLTDTNASEWWPGTITDHDGCFGQQLVRGGVPQGVLFKPAYWLTLENK